VSVENDLAEFSVVLVHEATHHVHGRRGVMAEEELHCFELALLFYAELMPPGLTYYDARRARRAAMMRVGGRYQQELQVQEGWARRQQLLDYVLSLIAYCRESLTPEWVERNAGNWGGVRNRWASTKGLFIRQLGAGRSPNAARLILEIMESIDSQANYTETVTRAGGENAMRAAIVNAIAASRNPLDIDRDRRFQTLQWGAELTPFGRGR
jgi:hypothetical protein